MPLARAKAYEAAGFEAALGVLCVTPAHEGEGEGDNPHPHDMGCCLPGARFSFDVPVAMLAHILAVPQRAITPRPAFYPFAQSRAPPAMTATPSQSRAPPTPA